MTHVVADRVQETSSTTGTGAFALAAAITGNQRFSAVCSVGDTANYCIVAMDGNGNPSGDWEEGIGTYSSANTLTRTTVKGSSNGGSAVNFGSGTKYVMLTVGATAAARLYKRGFSFNIVGTAPTADEVLATWTPPSGEVVTFADDFAGCVGKKIGGGTNPVSTYALVVKKNASDVGTITISTSGVVSFATTGTTVSLTGGTDTLTIYGATTPDAAVGYAFTMAGDVA